LNNIRRDLSLGTCHDQVRIFFAQEGLLKEKARIIFTAVTWSTKNLHKRIFLGTI
jgi:hypothetical protein